jgi:hypothetical protein
VRGTSDLGDEQRMLRRGRPRTDASALGAGSVRFRAIRSAIGHAWVFRAMIREWMETTMAKEVTLEMLQALAQQGLDGQAVIRRELADIRGLTLALNDKVQRLQRDLHEVKDDIWIMLKAELMGRMGNFETRIEARIDALSHPEN